jgi:hypothetical protein
MSIMGNQNGVYIYVLKPCPNVSISSTDCIVCAHYTSITCRPCILLLPNEAISMQALHMPDEPRLALDVFDWDCFVQMLLLSNQWQKSLLLICWGDCLHVHSVLVYVTAALLLHYVTTTGVSLLCARTNRLWQRISQVVFVLVRCPHWLECGIVK